jgi:hypothetical protein
MFLALWSNAQNLIVNNAYEKPLTKETRLNINSGWANLKVVTEDTTWNKAARMIVTKVHTGKDNNRKFQVTICIGGDGKNNNTGFPVDPESRYRFSLRLKTSIKPV